MSWNPYMPDVEGNRIPTYDPYGVFTQNSYNDYHKQLSLMAAGYSRDTQWFNEFDSEQARMERLRSLGVNETQALASILGSPSNATMNPSSSNLVNDFTPLDAIGTAGSFFGDMSSGLNSIVNIGLQSRKNQSDIDLNKAIEAYYGSLKPNIDAATAGINIDNDNKQQAYDDAHSESVANVANTEASSKNLDEERNVIKERYRLTKADADLAEKQAAAYDELSDAQIQEIKSRTAKYWSGVALDYQSIETQQKQIEHDADRLSQEYRESNSRIGVNNANKEHIESETAARDFANEFEQAIGYPLNADIKDKINGLARQGKFDDIENLLQASFDVTHRESMGKSYGEKAGSIPGSGVVSNAASGHTKRKYKQLPTSNP